MLWVHQKTITRSEIKNKNLVRKSIVAKINIRKGEIFTEKNLTTKRPGLVHLQQMGYFLR